MNTKFKKIIHILFAYLLLLVFTFAIPLYGAYLITKWQPQVKGGADFIFGKTF